MRNMFMAGAMGLALCAATAAFAGETWPPPAPDDQAAAPAEGPDWLAGVAGQKLVAVDGSTLTLSPSEGGVALALTSPNGTAQNATLAFISDKLGTISDDANAGHVIGFFRETDTGLEAQFADGRTESLVANTAGGVSLTIRSDRGSSSCTSWYPPDHVFGAAERRAALAAYAARLGLGQHSKSVPPSAACAPAIRIAKNTNQLRATRSLSAVVHPAAPAMNLGGAALVPVVVRTSEVHVVDGPVSAAAAPVPTAIQTAVALAAPQAATQPTPAPVSATAPTAAPTPAVQSGAATQAPKAASPQPSFASATSVPDGRGASDCLSVESDGANLGFRNHCAYGVQFAYCLKKASDPATACDAGSKAGAVAANAFAAVLMDTNIKTADAEHDFRWVACSGNSNDVVAHLDRADPPAGRCVLSSAS